MTGAEGSRFLLTHQLFHCQLFLQCLPCVALVFELLQLLLILPARSFTPRLFARALAQTYAKGFYMGLRAGLYFELDESGRTVTATVTIFRDADMTDAVFSDSLLIDLRYDIPVKTGVTAQQRPAA